MTQKGDILPGRKTPAYRSWQSMKQRCSNPVDVMYPMYGGRGVEYDPSWEDFDVFYAELGSRPEGTTLDRIDNTRGYYPGNCRWASYAVQRQNQEIQVKPRSDSSTGIRGVSKETFYSRFKVEVKRNGIRMVLYRGGDFFEACCARKSFEVKELAGTL